MHPAEALPGPGPHPTRVTTTPRRISTRTVPPTPWHVPAPQGVGSHAAHLLLRSGVGKLRLIDFDQVRLSS